MQKVIYETTKSTTLFIISVIFDLILILSYPNLVFSFIGSIFLIKESIMFYNTYLKITSDKVVGKSGLINGKIVEVTLKEIKEVETYQNFFGKIFCQGSIIIKTSSDTLVFKHISNPSAFKYILENQIEKNKK